MVIVLTPRPKKIQINPNLFLHLKWNLGFQLWGIPYDDPLPQKARKKLAKIFSEKLNDRLEIFFKGKKQGTFKNTIIILKYLLGTLEYPYNFPHEFTKIRLNELEEELVFYCRWGRPKINKIKISQKNNRKICRNWERSHSEKIPYQNTLINILNKLVDEEILIKIDKMELTERSNPNKKKTNAYYSINPKIFQLSIVTTKSEAEPDILAKTSKEVLIANYRELQRENNILQESFLKSLRINQENQKDLYAAKEILKERGISQPDDAISLWLSTNKVWA